ncbi:BnaCnng54580D [Brassica napus]|uniref:BnaCnng54580D protein n=2 Tax=Brassica TaxID=3705 RepID=A0A078JIG7_BRANA|nr:BnaCnng54580D [Brassica napus]
METWDHDLIDINFRRETITTERRLGTMIVLRYKKYNKSTNKLRKNVSNRNLARNEHDCSEEKQKKYHVDKERRRPREATTQQKAIIRQIHRKEAQKLAQEKQKARNYLILSTQHASNSTPVMEECRFEKSELQASFMTATPLWHDSWSLCEVADRTRSIQIHHIAGIVYVALPAVEITQPDNLVVLKVAGDVSFSALSTSLPSNEPPPMVNGAIRDLFVSSSLHIQSQNITHQPLERYIAYQGWTLYPISEVAPEPDSKNLNQSSRISERVLN